jgi:hypothetical protein
LGKTRRRDPIARELAKPQYRQRRKGDKRRTRLEELNNKEWSDEPLVLRCPCLKAIDECDLCDLNVDDPTKIKEGALE